MCQYPLSHSPSHLPEGSTDLGWLSTAPECLGVETMLAGVFGCWKPYTGLAIQDPPTAQWGVHECGKILLFDGFLVNLENLCYSYDE